MTELRQPTSQQVKPARTFGIAAWLCCAALAGLVTGVALSIEPRDLTRWPEYQAIRVGMEQDQVVAIVDASDKSHSGCGVHHGESRDAVCRFEDPWRGYTINFDPDTKRVNRKAFFFKRVPGLRLQR